MNWISRWKKQLEGCRFRLLIVLLLLVSSLSPALAGSSPPKVVVRVHIQNMNKELKKQTFMVQLPDPPEQISVSTLPEASEKDVLNVTGKPTTNGFGAYIQFNRRGSVNLSATTAQNQGRILVVVINNRVVYAPVIDTVISNGILFIPDGISPKEMEALSTLAKYNSKRAKF
ncbi:MAG: hypothetical protein ACAI35_02425 [Candidatus Methylacidiphilales bacterium]|nr:hypothetical protein [Candidatus Methylacidiphilales bacterium]